MNPCISSRYALNGFKFSCRNKGGTGVVYSLLPTACKNQWQAEMHDGCTLFWAVLTFRDVCPIYFTLSLILTGAKCISASLVSKDAHIYGPFANFFFSRGRSRKAYLMNCSCGLSSHHATGRLKPLLSLFDLITYNAGPVVCEDVKGSASILACRRALAARGARNKVSISDYSSPPQWKQEFNPCSVEGDLLQDLVFIFPGDPL